MKEKKSEKIEKYQDLALEITRMWETKTKVIVVVIGVLGAKFRINDWMVLLEVNRKMCSIIQELALFLSRLTYLEKSCHPSL